MQDPLYGWPAAVLAQVARVHFSTARRWKRTRNAPAWLGRLIALCLEGDLGEIDRTWRGWKLTDGKLISPEGWTFGMGEIRSLPFLHAQVKTYQQKLRFEIQADWIEGRYVEPKKFAEGPKAA